MCVTRVRAFSHNQSPPDWDAGRCRSSRLLLLPSTEGQSAASTTATDKKIVKTAKIKPNTHSVAPELPVKLAPQVEAKNEGNLFFKDKKYREAIDCYTKAMNLCPAKNTEELSTFYQNRAAANEMLDNMSDVIADCTSALNLNKRYKKALLRRAKAHEKQDDLSHALSDITATCIIKQFENESSLG